MLCNRVDVAGCKVDPIFANFPVLTPEVEVCVLSADSQHVGNLNGIPASAVDEKRCLDWFFCMAEVNHQVVRSNGHRFDIRVQ